METLEPRIYVACLAAYNNGYLHGAWIDANQNVEALFSAIKEILSNSPMPNAEEWAIHDTDNFYGVVINESENLETVSALAAFIAERGELGAEVLNHTCNSLDDAEKLLEENYHGEFDSEADFVEQFLIDTGTEVPEHLVYYIDYERMARDWFMSDFFSVEVDRKVHVFSHY